jgi:hypothetical protein
MTIMNKQDYYYQEREYEHDDVMSAEDYERKEYYRNGWNEEQYERQRF